jgi:ABC-type sugar transport system permease subunit
MIIWLSILNVFQNDQQYPQAQYPENNIFDQIPAFGNTMFFVLLIMIIWFASGIFLAYIVSKDLKKREASGNFYIIITFLASVIGLLIYYIVRYNEKCALEENEELCLLQDDKKEDV